MKFCTKCGTQCDDAANCCHKCGNRFDAAPAAAAAPAPQAMPAGMWRIRATPGLTGT